VSVRDNPPATTADAESLRPLLAVGLGIALLAGVFVLATGGPADPTNGGTTVEVTATPDPDAAPAAAYDPGSFTSPSPVRRAVGEAAANDDRTAVTATVESREAVRLGSGDAERTYHVRVDEPGAGPAFYRVTVAVTG
jgi:hypothetical protein